MVFWDSWDHFVPIASARKKETLMGLRPNTISMAPLSMETWSFLESFGYSWAWLRLFYRIGCYFYSRNHYFGSSEASARRFTGLMNSFRPKIETIPHHFRDSIYSKMILSGTCIKSSHNLLPLS